MEPAQGAECVRVGTVVFERLGRKEECFFVGPERDEEVGIDGSERERCLVCFETLFEEVVRVDLSALGGGDGCEADLCCIGQLWIEHATQTAGG